MKKFLTAKTFIVVALVAVVLAVIYSQYAGNKANEGVSIERHLRGNPEAPVVLTEYSDFQCPACGQFHSVVKDLLETYDGQLAVEYKHFPLIAIHPFAVPAAKAAEAAAQQGKFWEMHDKLFENQQLWTRASNPRPHFAKYAEEIGLDVDQFNRQYGASLIEDTIAGSYEEARELGLTGTPTFFLNGERIEFTTFEEFTAAIDAAMLGAEGNVPEQSGADNPAGSEVRFGF